MSGQDSAAREKKIKECMQKIASVEQTLNDTINDVRKTVKEVFEEQTSKRVQTVSAVKPTTNTKLTRNAPKGLGKQDKDKCKKAFDKAKGNNNSVNIAELRTLLEETHGTTLNEDEFEQLKDQMKAFDFSQDGELQYEEFLVLYAYSDAQKKKAFQVQARKALSADAEDDDDKNLDQRIHIDGVPMFAVQRYLRKELDETAACIQLPWAVLLFCGFMLSVMWHFRFERLHAVDEAITWDIEQNANFAFAGTVPFEGGRMGFKTIYDVNSIPDFWSWFNMGLTPLFWPSGWDTYEVRGNTATECSGTQDKLKDWGGYDNFVASVPNSPGLGPGPCAEGQDSPVWPTSTKEFFGSPSSDGVDGHYLLFHSIVGGVRMRQERITAVECNAKDMDVVKAVHTGLCLDDKVDYWLMPEVHKGLDFNKVHLAESKTQYFWSRLSQKEVRDQLRKLENEMWFDPETVKIEITFATYNPHADLLTASYILLFVNQGGHIHKMIEPVSFFLHPYHQQDGVHCYVADILFCILMLKLLIEESIDLCKHWKQLGFTKGTGVYMSFGNAVDWASIAYFILLAVFWFIQLNRLNDLSQVLKRGSPTAIGTFSSEADRKSFFDQIDVIVDQVQKFRVMLAVFPCIICSRFFKAFALQPRLAIVTKTLTQASIDIVHFGIVFGTVFCVFALSSLILWGQEIEYFANYMRSLNNVYLMLLGDVDWPSMHEVGRPIAYIEFWVYQWFVNLITLNMLIALVMDVYTEVWGQVGQAETLWSQAYEIYARKRDERMGRAQPFRKVLQLLDPTDLEEEDEVDETLIFVETLRSEHGLTEHQAVDILKHSLALYDQEKAAGSNPEHEASKRLQHIDTKITQMHRFMDRLSQGNNDHVFGLEFQAGHTPAVRI